MTFAFAADSMAAGRSFDRFSGNEPEASNVRISRTLRPEGASWRRNHQYSTMSVALLSAPLARLETGRSNVH